MPLLCRLRLQALRFAFLLAVLGASLLGQAQPAPSGWPWIYGTQFNDSRTSGGYVLPAQKWSIAHELIGGPAPIIGPNGIVYLGLDGGLSAVDEQTGNILWSIPWAYNHGNGTQPVIDKNGVLYACGVTGYSDTLLVAIDGATGKTLWSRVYDTTNAFIPNGPTAIGPDGTLYVYGGGPFSTINQSESALMAFDPKDGSTKWSFQWASVIGAEIVSAPAFAADGTVYVNQTGAPTYSNNSIYALNPADGSVKWHTDWSQIYGFGGSIAPSVGPDGTIYCPSHQETNGYIYAFEPTHGNLIQRLSAPTPLKVPVAIGPDGTLYFSASDRNIYAFDPKTGSTLWSFQEGAGIGTFGQEGPIVGADGALYMASQDGNLYSLDAQTGGLRWSIPFPQGQPSAIAISRNGTLVYGTYGASISISALRSINVLSLTIKPTPVVGGNSATGTITLTQQAPSGGFTATLSSDSTFATVPASVVVPAGQTSATFTIKTLPVSVTTIATLTAVPGFNVKGSMAIVPAPVASVAFSPSTVGAGETSTGTVTLAGAAGPDGDLVSLSADKPLVKIPRNVLVPAGQTTATFTAKAGGVSTPTDVTVTATLNGKSQTTVLTINPPTLTGLTLDPTSVIGGNPSTGTIALSGPAGVGGLNITLSSDSAAAGVPQTVTVPNGQAGTTFTVSTSGVNAKTTANISAALAGANATSKLTISPASVLSLTLDPSTVVGGNSTTGTVMLTGQAGPGGITVTVTSNNPAATVPSSITIPSGQSFGTFTVGTDGMSAVKTATITVAYGGKSLSATLTVLAASLLSVTIDPPSIIGGLSSTGAVTLNGNPPPSGVVVKLTSSKSTAVVPASVSIGAGKSSASFVVKTISVTAQTSVVITAKLNGVTVSANLSVLPDALLSVTVNPTTIKGGSNATGTVTLVAPAPSGGAVVAISSDTGTAGVPKSVTVPAGKTSATFTIKTVKVKSQASATISGSYNGTTKSATLTVS